jgi:hypothetical protein
MVNGVWITRHSRNKAWSRYKMWMVRHRRKGMENGCGSIVTCGIRHGEWMGWLVSGGIHSIENGVWMDG